MIEGIAVFLVLWALLRRWRLVLVVALLYAALHPSG